METVYNCRRYQYETGEHHSVAGVRIAEKLLLTPGKKSQRTAC